ncbi:MAG TPA: hypothetical protein VHX61_14570 [Rhizomicrobium sp.]|jgi:hypothetical protein|nr:hypothetical protein [Rhizomicrobium sp.]
MGSAQDKPAAGLDKWLLENARADSGYAPKKLAGSTLRPPQSSAVISSQLNAEIMQKVAEAAAAKAAKKK